MQDFFEKHLTKKKKFDRMEGWGIAEFSVVKCYCTKVVSGGVGRFSKVKHYCTKVKMGENGYFSKVKW